MFPEYRDLISKLKKHNTRFDALFEKHNQLDHDIKLLENAVNGRRTKEIIELKLKKLGIKREIQKILEDYDGRMKTL